MFGGGKKEKEQADKIADLERQLQERSQQLQQNQTQLQTEQERVAAAAERDKEGLQQARTEFEELESIVQESQEAAASAAEREAKQKSELAEGVHAVSRLTSELSDAQNQLKAGESTAEGLRAAQEAYEKKLAESEIEAKNKQEALVSLSHKFEDQHHELEEEIKDKAAAHGFLDVAIGECEFASPFAYSVSCRLKSRSDEVRSTDVSQASTRPIFNITSMLLPTAMDVTEEILQVSVFANISDPVDKAAPPVARLLGEAVLALKELKVTDGSTSSRRTVRSINFVRMTGTDATDEASKKLLTVGRATLAMQLKVLTPSEVSGASTARGHTADPAPAALMPLLDRSLWIAQPFQHRICALVHSALALPAPPEGSRATARVALRLRRPDGQVLYESISTDVPITASGDSTGLTSAVFAQELVLPLKLAEGSSDIRVQLAVEIVSASAGASGATTSAVLDVSWPHEVLPYMKPLHLYARASDGSAKSSHARPRPGVMVSLVREPAHEELDTVGDAMSQAVEFRIHGVPLGRPLPDISEDTIVAICPEPATTDGRGSDPQIPIATFYYDQPMDFKTFVESHFRSASGNVTSYFLSPTTSGGSRTPQWSQYAMRFLASPAALENISIYLFENRAGRVDPDAPLSGSLLGFAMLDASTLQHSAGSGPPLHRSFLLDLRLLEAPGSGSSLELECRVWPRGDAPKVEATSEMTSHHLPPPPLPPPPGQDPATSSSSALLSPFVPSPHAAHSNTGASALSLGNEAHEFRLNHELSVQLAKEFNLRASALKKAGEEIMGLRRQVQLLRGENTKLKGQLQDEEQLAEDVQRRPPPEGFDSLSSAELASKLQRALEKYREEKSKSVDMGQRLEEALKEASRGRGLQRTLEELESAHLQQNKELQRLQEQNRKIDAFRQAAKTQEKVIAKLEKILEGSLQEVQKAQRMQVDMERLKTENLRLREKCTQLAARRRGAAAGEEDVEDLRREIDEKDREIKRLEAIAHELRAGRSTAAPVHAPDGPDVAGEQRRVRELEDSQLEWEQRCVAAEHRLNMLQHQLTESSKRYGGEITSLQVEVAKREAKILELEFLLKDSAGRASAEGGGWLYSAGTADVK